MVLTAKVDSSMHPLNELNGFLYHSVPLPPPLPNQFAEGGTKAPSALSKCAPKIPFLRREIPYRGRRMHVEGEAETAPSTSAERRSPHLSRGFSGANIAPQPGGVVSQSLSVSPRVSSKPKLRLLRSSPPRVSMSGEGAMIPLKLRPSVCRSIRRLTGQRDRTLQGEPLLSCNAPMRHPLRGRVACGILWKLWYL